jgi:hypothetical protein
VSDRPVPPQGDCKILRSGHPWPWLAAARLPIGVSVRSFILEKKRESDGGLADAAPHYHGHRERLRGRFRDVGADALSDYELLELLLFRALPRRDV